MTEVEEKFVAIFGPSLHTSSSEVFFSHSSYDTLEKIDHLTINFEGKVMDSFEYQDKVHGRWICSELCKVSQKSTSERFYWIITVYLDLKPNEIVDFIDNIDIYSNVENFQRSFNLPRKCKCGEDYCEHIIFHDKDQRKIPLGHPSTCYEEEYSCNSILLFFRRLSPHFPFIRQLVKLIYNIMRELKMIRHLTHSLQTGDIEDMQHILMHV